MIEVRYGVVQMEGRWVIIGEGLRFGSFETESEAEEVVRRMAGQAAGLKVQLHLQRENGEFRREDVPS